MNAQLNRGQIRHGIWRRDYNEWNGSEPSTVEGAQACTIDSTCYVFGGFARTIFNELRSFNTSRRCWSLLSPDYNTPSHERPRIPEPRTGHSLCSYRSDLVLFGGAGTYNTDVRMRFNFCDLWVFKTEALAWREIISASSVPKRRMNHAMACLGGLMLVHGGENSEAKVTLDDFSLFDFRTETWLPIKTCKPNLTEFKP